MNKYKSIINDLIALAQTKNVKVRIDLDTTGFLWHRSVCNYDRYTKLPDNVQVYANTDFICAIVLAHEIGHVFTCIEERYRKDTVFYEVQADKWALNYLLYRLTASELNKAIKIYNQCIDNYRNN
jgi:hypothetical protein